MKTDNNMTKAWAEVYNGTDKSDEQVLQDFRVLYARDMYREDEQPITDITVEQLRDAFRHIKNNAASPDAWEDITLRKLTDNFIMMAGDNAQRNRERDEMAKTDHQSTRDPHTKREPSKPRSLQRAVYCSSCHRSTENGPR